MDGRFSFDLIPSFLGEVGLVRRRQDGRTLIRRIFLPHGGISTDKRIRDAFPDAVPEKAERGGIGLQLRAFLAGEAVDFTFAELDFEIVGGFTRRVLLADREIPRGRVMTYGGLAAKLGLPGGARAVGNAMAANPFPLICPCHRVIRSGGGLGGFGGGLPMKKALLTMEGVAFDRNDRVLPQHIIGGG